MSKPQAYRTSFWITILMLALGFNPPSALGQYASSGKQFHFTFIQNRINHLGNLNLTYSDINEPELSIYIFNSSTNAAGVTVGFNGDSTKFEWRNQSGVALAPAGTGSVSMTIGPGASQKINVVPVATNSSGYLDTRPLQAMNNGQIQRKCYSIRSTEDVAVFAESRQVKSRDASLILPDASLGFEYIVASYNPEPLASFCPSANDLCAGGPSEIAVVALDAATIQVSLTAVASSNVSPTPAVVIPANTTVTYNLQPGDVIQFQSDNGDLSGSRIWTDPGKRLAVFSGNMGTRITGTRKYWDMIFDQMYPVNAWRCAYVAPPLYKPATGFFNVYKIIASQDSTLITINNVTLSSSSGNHFFRKGESVELKNAMPPGIINAPLNVTTPLFIQGDHPIAVFQYCLSSMETNSENLDPFLIALAPVDQTIMEAKFVSMPQLLSNCGSATDKKDYLNIVTLTSETGNFMINSGSGLVPLSTYGFTVNWQPLSAAPMYSYATIDVSNLNFTLAKEFHLLKSPGSQSGFNAYVYGFDCREGYGYAAGVNLQPKVTLFPASICKGASTQLHATGGTAWEWTPPDFLDDPFSQNPVSTPDSSITYAVRIADSLGCDYIDSVHIDVATTAGPALTVTVSVTAPGLNTGAMRVNVSNGTPPFRYSLDNVNFQSSNLFTSLALGTYTIYVADDAGCTTESIFVLDEANCMCGAR